MTRFACRWCHQMVHSTGLYWVDAKGRYECPKRYAAAHKPAAPGMTSERAIPDAGEMDRYGGLRDTPHRARLLRVMDRVAPFGLLRSELFDCVFDIEAAALAATRGEPPEPGPAIDVERLASALRAAEQMSADHIGIKGPAYDGPPPEWYRGYAARAVAEYDRLRP